MNGHAGIALARRLASAWRTITLVVMGLLGAAVLVGLIVTLGEANRQRDRALELQSHSYDVMILARTLSSTIARSEASLGRYVISGDKQLGRLYFDEWLRAGEQINRLEDLTRDNGGQQPRIDRLRAAYDTRGAELSLTALSTNYGKNSQALARYYQARKAPALFTIIATLDDIIARERMLLKARTTVAMTTVGSSARAARVLSVFGILIVIGAIALGWITVRATTERATARAEAEMERGRAEELVLAVCEATDALRVQEAQLRQVQKMEAVGQLTGGIAHDFNNMLAVVLGGLELASRNLATGSTDIARHLDSATEGANRAASLTRQLLAFAREDAINPEPIDAGGLIEGMRDLIDRTLGGAVTVTVLDDSAGWRVRADRVQLENTVLNLAVNARDAMEARGEMTIIAGTATLDDGARAACPAGDYLTIAVVDSGCGMPPEVIERVFEPFFTTKPVGKGTGLGLSQIFGFVRQLGGDVDIVSTPGDGTTVTLYLPRDVSIPIVPVADIVPAAAVAVGSWRALSILVVEDDPRVLCATIGALEELGHVAIPCDDPLAASGILDGHGLDGRGRIDLIITDVLMPKLTGPEMIAALDPRHAEMPVLFVTGFAGEGGEAGEFGRHPVLRKPYTLAGLERAIDGAVGAVVPSAHESVAAE